MIKIFTVMNLLYYSNQLLSWLSNKLILFSNQSSAKVRIGEKITTRMVRFGPDFVSKVKLQKELRKNSIIAAKLKVFAVDDHILITFANNLINHWN